MVLMTESPVFLAFDIGRFVRGLSSLQGMLLGLGVVVICGVLVYLYYYIKDMIDIRRAEAALGDDAEGATEKLQSMQKKMDGRRKKLIEEREMSLKDIPSGPVEDKDLPPATVRVRNRIENVPSDAEFSIGKSPDSNLVIPELGVSRKHAKIRPEKDWYVLYDLVSTRGTFVNGQKVTKRSLRDGDQIKIGPETIIFNVKK